MRARLLWIVLTVCLAILALTFGTASGTAQTPSKFKNILVMKGMTDKEIQAAMQQWAKQLGTKCAGCHVQGDFASDEKPEKKTARKMFQMVQLLNQQEFFKSGERKADCYLCHKGSNKIPPMGETQ